MSYQLIGKGAFTKAYRKDDVVYLKSCDPIKECMAHGWFPESRLFPKVKFSDVDGFDYEMKYYPREKSLKKALRPRQYRLYKALKSISDDRGTCANKYQEYSKWYEKLSSLPSEFSREKEVILEGLDGCTNTGSCIAFEISPRNVAVDNGFLVLLDVFFNIETLHEVRK